MNIIGWIMQTFVETTFSKMWGEPQEFKNFLNILWERKLMDNVSKFSSHYCIDGFWTNKWVPCCLRSLIAMMTAWLPMILDFSLAHTESKEMTLNWTNYFPTLNMCQNCKQKINTSTHFCWYYNWLLAVMWYCRQGVQAFTGPSGINYKA